jgi:hypothetical protein
VLRFKRTSCLGAAQASAAGSNTGTTFAVVAADHRWLGRGLLEVIDGGKTSSHTGEQVTSLQVLRVQSNDGRKAISSAVGVDEGGNSRNRGESGREMHVE